MVVLRDNILGKPKDPIEATQMLRDLRDRPHQVYSGLTVAAVDRSADCNPHSMQMITRLHQSTVWMRPYTDAEIEAYVATGDPLDKAGAYGIQNKGFAPVARLEGCFASVMGFPLGELAAALRELGVSLPEIGRLCVGHTGQKCCQQ